MKFLLSVNSFVIYTYFTCLSYLFYMFTLQVLFSLADEEPPSGNAG